MLKFKKGDTLVEIALAIGVLGFVVAAVSVTMTTTLGASEYSLEDTMARNEMDVQAEALRYIHNAYSAQKSLTEDSKEYAKLWRAITAQAVKPNEIPEFTSDIKSCADFYPDKNASSPKSLYTSQAFIVNTHRLNVADAKLATNTKDIIVTAKNSNPAASRFQPAYIYPRVIYGNLANTDNILDQAININTYLARVEGLWIQAACSDNFNPDGSCNTAKTNYFDFYIRSCWESARDHSTSTIGTIVRLHNPDLEIDLADTRSNFSVNYYRSDQNDSKASQTAVDFKYHYFDVINRPGTIPATSSDGWTFKGWCIANSSHNSCGNVDAIFYPHGSYGTDSRVLADGTRPDLNMLAVYQGQYIVNYQPGGSGVSGMPSTSLKGLCNSIQLSGASCTIDIVPNNKPTRSGYVFLGWKASNGYNYNDTNRNHTFVGNNMTITLTAQWQEIYKVTYDANADGKAVTGMPSPATQSSTCVGNTCKIKIQDQYLERSDNYVFVGWSTVQNASRGDEKYWVEDLNGYHGNTVTLTSNITLYAIWEYTTYKDWRIVLEWTQGFGDLDSYTYTCSGYSCSNIYYGSRTGSYNGTSMALDRDVTSYPGKETTSVEHVGTNTIYFCINTYHGSAIFANTNAKITVNNLSVHRTWTFTPPSGNYSSWWYAIKIKNNTVTANSNPFGSGCTGW